MKILLVSGNRERQPDPIFPIGAYYIARAVYRSHQVEYIDLLRDPVERLFRIVETFKPDVIGLSIRNIDNTLYPDTRFYLKDYKSLVEELRPGFKGIIVLGGSGFSVMPEQALEYIGADYGIAGNGEDLMLKFLNDLDQGILPETRVLYDDRAEKAWPTFDEHLDELDKKFHLKWYYRNGGSIGVSTKRGCPHGCIYCTYSLIEGTCFQLRPVKSVVDEVQYHYEGSGIRHFFFTDSIFNVPTDHSVAIAEEIIARQLPIKWIAYFNPVGLTREVLETYRRSGCEAIDLGVESGSDRILQRMGKDYTAAMVREVSGLCRDLHIPFSFNLLLGSPGENEETLRETFQLIDKVNPLVIFTNVGVRVYPKTEIYRIAQSELGLSESEDLIHPYFYINPAIKDKIQDIVKTEATRNHNIIVPSMNLNFKGSLAPVFRFLGIKGASWVNRPADKRRAQG